MIEITLELLRDWGTLLKKISIASITILVVIILTTFLNYLVYNNYYNEKIIYIVSKLASDNEHIEIEEIAEIIKSDDEIDYNALEDYGYSANDLYLIGDIKYRIVFNACINIIVVTVVLIIFGYIYYRKGKGNLSEINDLLNLLEKINKGDYNINLDKYSESDFSKLRNEIYKTTVLLKEHSEFLNNDRILLKDNLADISHQIRTPLTSISLMLETIIEDKNMPEDKKDEFLNSIFKQTDKINYLVEALLKLSKFDASVIHFKKDNVNVYNLLNNVKSSLRYLLDEKNMTLNISVDKDIKIICDEKWQEEAITNIVKNSIEFSKENSQLDIEVKDNNFYTMITIKDYGSGISKTEIKKIFDRFHKNNNSSGFGIGLNLAKTIIEKDGGLIDVESKENEYTIFTIKYVK